MPITPNLTLDQIIEKAIPTRNITCAIEKRLKLQCQRDLREYLLDWHKRAKADEQLAEAAKMQY